MTDKNVDKVGKNKKAAGSPRPHGKSVEDLHPKEEKANKTAVPNGPQEKSPLEDAPKEDAPKVELTPKQFEKMREKLHKSLAKTLFKFIFGGFCFLTVVTVLSLYSTIRSKAEEKMVGLVMKEFESETIRQTIKGTIKDESAALLRSETEATTNAFEASLSTYIANANNQIDSKAASIAVVNENTLKLMTKADNIVTEFSTKNQEMQSQLETIRARIKGFAEQIKPFNEYTRTVFAAQLDDRRAFDQLGIWASCASFYLKEHVSEVYQSIIDKYHTPLLECGTYPWPEGYNAAEKTFKQLINSFPLIQPNYKPAFLQYICERTDCSKKEKTEFFINVLCTDLDLKAAAYAGYFIIKENDLDFQPLEIKKILTWYENKIANSGRKIPASSG